MGSLRLAVRELRGNVVSGFPGLMTKDHKFAGSEFGRHRRLREAKVSTRDGRDQSVPGAAKCLPLLRGTGATIVSTTKDQFAPAHSANLPTEGKLGIRAGVSAGICHSVSVPLLKGSLGRRRSVNFGHLSHRHMHFSNFETSVLSDMKKVTV